MKPGDLLLVSSNDDIEAAIIHFGTTSHWNHVCGYVPSATGGLQIAEATRKGIALAKIDKYKNADTHLIETNLTDDQRAAACMFALSCVGQTYGFGQIAAISASWLTGKRWFFGREGTEDCASYWARALEHAGLILPKAPELYRPRDFADLFDVTPRLEQR